MFDLTLRKNKPFFFFISVVLLFLFFPSLYTSLTWLTCQDVHDHYYSYLPLILLQGNKVMEQQIPFSMLTYDPLGHIQFIAIAA